MADIIKTMKLHIHVDDADRKLLEQLTAQYAKACNFVSDYMFDNGFPLNYVTLSNCLYQTIRNNFFLKSQMTQSVFKTVTARYKTVKKQFSEKPYGYKGADKKWHSIARTLEWLQKPISFKRPQADLVRNRDYSFVCDKNTGESLLSLNTLGKRIRVSYDVPEIFLLFFDGTSQALACGEEQRDSWNFGTGKLVSLKGEWYFHIPMTKANSNELSLDQVKHVVGVDRGLRFLTTTYDEVGKTRFANGSKIMAKRDSFQKVRDQLQSKGTKSAKRVLKRISGRENRWMSDVNHQISKALVERYGEGTLFALEDLAGVSFAEENAFQAKRQGPQGSAYLVILPV